jgi:tRNA A-37 threonylcarbamoyl transferase component Bud32/tetratricopeptide (TPR) repeat protein
VITHPLGKGGFGEAYLATDTHLERPCVVKRLRIDPTWNTATRHHVLASFAREARLLVSLNTPGHPHIPEIYEYLPSEQCLVMKYINGQSLLKRLKHRTDPVPEVEALRYIRDICRALVYMHSRTPEPILHRDLKPDNILLDSTGHLWLIDFGLAKGWPADHPYADPDQSRAAGTPGYAPLEQWQGRPEPRSDIYALAATLYELLAQRRPAFAGLASSPPLRQLNPTVRVEVADLITRGMAPDPHDRPSAHAFLADIETLLAALEWPEPRESTGPPESAPLIGRADNVIELTQTLTTDHLLVISGMAGMGKTTLATHLARHSGPADATFWHTFHADTGIDGVLWSLAAFLSRQGQHDLWHQVQRVRHGGGHPPPPEALIDYLIRLLRGRSYWLCFDDIHLVETDPSIEALFQRLTRLAQAHELTLMLITRHLPRFLRSSTVSPLTGLNLGDSQVLVQQYGLTLDAALMARLHRITEGNPQLLILAVDALTQATRPADVLDRLTEAVDIERYLLHQVDTGLSTDERQVMQAIAALLGYGGTRAAIEALLDGQPCQRTLVRLHERHLLTRSPAHSVRVYTQHAIVEAFYYETLSRSQRRTLHQRAAAFYTHEAPDRFKAAYHLERAEAYEHAAILATSDVQTWINHGEAHALGQLLDRIPVDQLTPETHVALQIARGTVATLMRTRELARTSFQLAFDLLTTLPATAGQQTRHAQICHGMGELLEQEDPDEALIWLYRGLAQENDPLAGAILNLRIGSVLTGKGDYHEARVRLEQGLELLPNDAHSAIRASALVKLGVLSCTQGQVEVGLTYYRQALSLYESIQDYWNMIGVWNNLAIELDIAGDWTSAVTDYQQALDLARQLGSVARQVDIEICLGVLRTNQGEFAAAREHLLTSLELARSAGLKEQQINGQANLADLAIRQQEWDAAAHALAEAWAITQETGARYQIPELLRLEAQVHLAHQDVPAALSNGERALALAHDMAEPREAGLALRIIGQAWFMAEQNPESAWDALARSVALLEAHEPYEAARTQALWGHLVSVQSRELAQELLEAARLTFERLGARHDQAMVMAVLDGL